MRPPVTVAVAGRYTSRDVVNLELQESTHATRQGRHPRRAAAAAGEILEYSWERRVVVVVFVVIRPSVRVRPPKATVEFQSRRRVVLGRYVAAAPRDVSS